MEINPEIHNWTIQRIWDFGKLRTKWDVMVIYLPSKLRNLWVRGVGKIVTERGSRWPQRNSIVETQQVWGSQETVEGCAGPAQVQPRQKSQPWEGEVGTKSYLPTKKLFVVVIPARTEKNQFSATLQGRPYTQELLINPKQTPCFLCDFCLFGWLACLIWCFVWVLVKII